MVCLCSQRCPGTGALSLFASNQCPPLAPIYRGYSTPSHSTTIQTPTDISIPHRTPSRPKIWSHLAALYDTLVEKLYIAKPYAVVEIESILQVMGNRWQAVEANYVLCFCEDLIWFYCMPDQGQGCLVVFN